MASNFWENDPVTSDQWWSKDPEVGKQDQATRKSTIGSELVRGGKQLASSIRTGVGSLTGSPEEAAIAGVARSQSIGEEAGEGASLEAVKKAYQDRGLLSAAGEVASQIPRALAGQVPQLAAMAGGAKLGAMAGAPLGPAGVIGGGIVGAGATLLPQFFGSNIERQAAEQMSKDEQVKIDRAAAGAAAAGQAAIEGAGTAFVLGKRIVKGVLGVADDAAMATAKAQQAMTQAAERSLAAAAGRGVAKGAVVEMPVEIAQSVIERAQAGLDVTSPEALSEYGEVAYQAGLIGGAIGGGAGPIDTAMARQGVKAKAAFDEAEAKRKADSEAARTAAEEAEKAKTPPLALGAEGVFTPEKIEQPAAEESFEPFKSSVSAASMLGGTKAGGELAGMIRARRQEREDALVEQEQRARAPIPEAEQPGFNLLRGVDARNQGLMTTLEERRIASEAEAERARKAEARKTEAARADVDQRAAQVENFLMSPARKTQQETADYMAGVIPEMRNDFMALLDEDLNQPLTPEQTEALKAQIRQRLTPEVAPEQKVGRTPFKSLLASQGMNKKDVQDIFGENAYRANQQLPGAVRADAPRLDMLAEAAVEAGFLQEEDTEALVDMIKAEFSGDEQVAVDMAGDRAEAEYEAQRESELVDRANAIGLDTKGMTPDQIAARLGRIERKREEQRQRLAREVDGFADMPTAEQDRLVDVAMDQFGELQIFDVERAEQEGLMRDEDVRKQATTGSGYNIDPEDQRIEQELTGKSMLQAADWAVSNAPNAFAKVIAEKVRNRLREFQRKGMTLEFNISSGSTRPRMLGGARGITQFEWGKDDKGTKITVTLNGAAVMNNQAGYPPGVQYNTILHELLHVATRAQFAFMPNTDALKKQMLDLFNVVADRFNADSKAGTLPPVMMKYYRRMNNVLEDTDELLAWGLTDKEVQAYLDDIKVGEKSVFTRLVELIRTALGLGKPYESALERLVRNSESLLDVDVDAIDAMLGQKDKQIGVKKKPSGPMTQEGLFQKEGGERRSYGNAPRGLMGFRKSGPNKSYHESNYKKEITVRVTLDNGQSFVDGMKGLNTPHALERARRNWDGATIELLAEEPYSDELAAKFGDTSFQKEGKPAAVREPAKATPTDSAAFKKWSGGLPVHSSFEDRSSDRGIYKLYHMTTANFSEFIPGGLNPMDSGPAIFLSTNPSAGSATFRVGSEQRGFREGANTMPVFAKLKSPLVIDNKDMLDFAREAFADGSREFPQLISKEIVDSLKAEGYDSVIFDGKGVGWRDAENEILVFDPTQIKSATGNIGTYDPENADIRYQRDSITGKPILSQWTTPTDTKIAGEIGKDDIIYSLQNKMIDTKRVVDAITATAGKIAAKWNPYLQEELYHGRTAKQTKDFLADELRPLMQAMDKAGVNIEEMETYLKNRHAIAYNAQVAKVNPNMPDMGSGIATADAQKYLNGLSPADKVKYEALAKRVDSITRGTRKLLVDSGLETKETIDNWEKTFPFYVPLKRGDIDYAYAAGGMGTGQGFDVRGDFSRRAMGSTSEATDVLANIAMMRERAIVKAQKNRVAQALFGLAAQNPNPGFWLPVDPLAEVDPANMQELLNFGLSKEDLDFIAKEPRQKAVDKKRNEVVERINATLRGNENVLSMRFNGQDRYVFFNPNDPRSKRMAESLKNLDADQLGGILGPISTITRWMASVNTQFNPIFGAYNFLRDVQGAALQLSDTPLAKDRKAVVAGTLPALKGIYAAMRAERDGKQVKGEWSDLWQEFQKEGGQTGFRDQFSRSQERAEALEKELKQIREGKLKSLGRAGLNWLSDYNDSMENAVRLSAYKAALDRGIDKQEAASIAKNLTVNFNRKGQIAVQAGALYAFFNAAMQGTTRLVQTLKGPAGKKIIAGGLLLGAMQASLLAAAGFDEEEPPEFVRERNLILPIGGDKYLAFPMPLGYHVIPGVSRIITEWALSGFKDTPERIASMTGMFLEAFNPIGNAGWSAQTLAPTFADPIVALTENKDWTGKPIARKDFSNLDPTPGYTRAKDTASLFSTQIAKFLNYASGGTEFKPGVLSPTPDQIDYLIGQATGGLGREALKVEQTVTKTITGEELPSYKIPLVGRFYGETKSSAAESSRFYKNMTELNEHENEIKGRREKRQPIGDYFQENPEARLAPMARKTYADIQKLRKRREMLVERDAPRESVKAVENQITTKMRMLNERVEALSK